MEKRQNVISCLCIGIKCGKSRWETRYWNLYPCIDCGGSYNHNLEGVDRKGTSKI